MATTPKIDKSALNDPYYKDFLTRAQNDFGLDPNQEIDLNDPWTKLSMTIILTSLEQRRDNYSYDQFVKGIAKSIGANSDDYDKFIQNVSGSKSTQLGFENGSGTTSFVSPATPSVTKGGSSISITASIPYSSVAIQGAVSDIKIGATNPLGGITNYLTSATSGITNAVNSVVNTVTGAFTNTGVTQGAATTNVVGSAIGGTGGTVLVFAGTNNYTSTGNLSSDIKAIGDAIVAKGGTPVFVAPAPNINNIGNNNAQDAVINGARNAGYQVITPPPGSFVTESGGAQYHLSGAAIQNIANQAASLTGQKVVMANGDSNAVRAQQVLGVNGTATVGIGTGQILTDVGNKMPVIGSQLLSDNFYKSLNGEVNAGTTWDVNNQPPKELGPQGTDHFSQFGDKWLAVGKDGQFIDKNGQSVASYSQAASLSLSGSTATTNPAVATTPTPTADQITIDQRQFDNQFGNQPINIGSKVLINGHTYTVGQYGTLTPATAPPTTTETTTSTRTLADAPTNAEVGMPDNSTKSVKLADDGKTFQSATYTDPVTGLTKTVGADGTITLTGGGKTEIVGNYFGNQTAITEPPTAQQAGLPNVTEVLSTYDTSGKLVGVTYVTSPPSVADLQNQYRDVLDKKAPLEAEYDRLAATSDIAAADAAFEKLTPYYKQLDSLKTQIENGPVGTTYSLNLQTGKLTNDVTQEVTGTVSTKVDNSAALSQYNYLQQQKESLDTEAAARQGTDNPMSAGEYLSRSSEINQQITALKSTDTLPGEAGAPVQVAYNNVGNVNDATPIITGAQDSNLTNVPKGYGSEVDAYLGPSTTIPGPGPDYIPQPGYNASISSVNGTSLDPTTRAVGTPGATLSNDQIAGMPVTYRSADGSMTIVTPTNNNIDPNSTSNTYTPEIKVDDPKGLVTIDTNTGMINGIVQTNDPNAYLDAAFQGNQNTNMNVTNAVAYDPNLGLELGFQNSNQVTNMTVQQNLPTFAQIGLNGDQTLGVQAGTSTAGGFGLLGPQSAQTLAPGYTATNVISPSTPFSTDSNGTTTPGSDSVAGSTTPSSPGSPVTSAGSAAMGGGGC